MVRIVRLVCMAFAIGSRTGSGRGFGPVITLFLLLAISLLLLVGLISDVALFSRYQLWLLGFNLLLLVIFVVLVVINLGRLWRRYIQKRPGSRLAAKLAILFIGFALIPATVLYTFSIWLIDKEIESWFDVEVKSALNDALDLSRYSLKAQLNQYHKQLEPLIESLADAPDDLAAYLMNSHVESHDVGELLLLGSDQRIIASVSAGIATDLLPDMPSETILIQVVQGTPYLGIDPAQDGGFYARLVFALPAAETISESRILQVLYPVPQRINTLAAGVQNTYRRYDQLSYLRSGLQQNFIIVLTLVLLSAGVYAMWIAFFSTKLLMHPILRLTSATQAIAAGDLDTKIDISQRDDLGALVNSFNEMMHSLSEARDTRQRSQKQLENQRTYLHTVLANISSGVISLDRNLCVKTVNQAVIDMLGTSFEPLIDKSLFSETQDSAVVRFYGEIKPHLEDADGVWEEQFGLFVGNTYKQIICRGTKMPNGGYVIVLNDITQLIQAQRETAWGEVARHLAHEIKNPLTPIQLSTEQLSRKLAHKVSAEDAELLRRSTHTIIEQVKAMQGMVDEFSQYARPVPPSLKALEVNQLVIDIVDLYRSGKHRIDVELSPQKPLVSGDKSRLRQLLHNLLKNAIEALESCDREGFILVATRINAERPELVDLEIQDNGPGFSDDVIKRLFEPYSTTKLRGKGLGLAIVKKIVEEHNGTIQVNHLKNGVSIVVQLLRLNTV